jgi:hypothetical protein
MSELDEIRNILRPWLGEVNFNLGPPNNPHDIYVCISGISGCGFRSLAWQKNNADPDWLRPKWRTKSGVICPRCQTEIQAMLKSHRIDAYIHARAPYVFCKCIRLQPSRLPSLAFFTENWGIVLEALEFFERVAAAAEAERERERRADQARIASADHQN